ncbi:heavy metal translocating P-type ATPase [Sinimarinibacterium sp. NLF-5-8]|uniref:heavy metal translocating P-type ATPase n=1 Tax=Sinimarinibacterium sp. NLF-5-8 TaxID=2698684 RepID=UPI00137C0CA6|nr:heavy metal translocating P-type ATPase [Sinimarinibacterium sp. NLF-5-8]QHS10833.1 cadmium-translocating P-type ATPase [Sinimarinibacterium sp. NLF-5-8]
MTLDRCWHCGEPLPQRGVLRAPVKGTERAFCCAGCCAAATWIEQLGLGDYYRLRTQTAIKADQAEPENAALWDRPGMAQHVVRALAEDRHEVLLAVDGLRCAACVWLIERALMGVPGMVEVQVNPSAARARIVWHPARARLAQLLQILGKLGYRAIPLQAEALDDARAREAKAMLKRLIVAGFGAMQAMMYASALYLNVLDEMDAVTRDLMRWLGLLVATPVVFYAARPFFAGAWRSLRGRRLGMDVPVALAIALIYGASVVEAFTHGVEVYFDSVSMFVFFLLIGRYLEMRARHRAGHLTDALARLQPPFADRVSASGQIERVGAQELQIGDTVQISDGGLIPADGELLSARAEVDENLMTGEARAQAKVSGDALLAGTVLLHGPARIKVTRVGEQTALSAIVALAARAQAVRPQLAQAGERAASRFVLRVLSVAVLTAIGWAWIDPARAFAATVAVLVVSCPCAFALAVPAAITRSLSVLAQQGVLVTRPDALTALAQADHVLFDKTGTLTLPTLEPVEDQRALQQAAALARHSSHPVAVAVQNAWQGEPLNAENVRSLPGQGMSGIVQGRALRLGRDPHNAEDSALLLTDEGSGQMLARLSVTEALRGDSADTVRALQQQGLTVEILSGDARARVEHIAEKLRIDEYRARQTPADKLARLQQLHAQKAVVVMVGDGVNDAPVLAGADVAVALASGSTLAQTRSDVVLTGQSLGKLLLARAVAARALHILQQNQRWALVYNLAMIPPAALGFVPPWLAALGMSASSLVVILNALRITARARTPRPMPLQEAPA